MVGLKGAVVGATDDCSWGRDKSFPDNVIETNDSATAFQGENKREKSSYQLPPMIQTSIKSSEPPILMGVWGMLNSTLDVQAATMGFEKRQKGNFELGKSRTIGSRDVESTGQGNLIGAAGNLTKSYAINKGQALGTKLKPKGIQFKTVFEEGVEEPMSTRSQTKETRNLSNQKGDEFEDKKILNRKDDEELQKGGPNKNGKSTTDGLEERLDGSDLHPTESPSKSTTSST
ncbi:hypothetical protein BY996DRAFT_6521398 [Phakopsora pachyrhizi]|nr:hypothetical protein BY996DRAFT_6521398 [Phakopsora pachyrhizi]